MRDRGVSEVLSYTLVFSLVVTSVAIVSVGGLGTLQDARDAEQLDNAERAFDVLTDNVADIVKQGAPSRATEISLGQAQLVTDSNVTVNVSVRQGGTWSRVGSWEVRPIVYNGNQERAIAYEAGAVFRTNRDSGIVIREPPIVVNDERALVSVVGLNSPSVQSLGGSTVLVRTTHRSTDVAFADRSGSVEELNVTVESPRAGLWKTYLQSKGFTDCTDINDEKIGCDYTPGSNFERVYVVYHDISVRIDQ